MTFFGLFGKFKLPRQLRSNKTFLMKITRRQKDVILKLIQLYQQLDGRALHYTELAEFIGVNRFTAYDMLKVLEEKGLVQSLYRNEQGAGRSEVVFEPTQLARQLLEEVSPEITSEKWRQDDSATVPKNEHGEEVGREVLARIIPTDESVGVQECAELHAVLFIRLQNTHHYANLKAQKERFLPQNKPIGRCHLTLLLGISLGLLTNDQSQDTTWWAELTEQAEQYQAHIIDMSQPDCQRLSEIVHSLWSDLPTAVSLSHNETNSI